MTSLTYRGGAKSLFSYDAKRHMKRGFSRVFSYRGTKSENISDITRVVLRYRSTMFKMIKISILEMQIPEKLALQNFEGLLLLKSYIE